MQKGFFGAVRIAHTGCMDNISELINAAKYRELLCLFFGLTLIDFRERLAEVHDEYEDRERRWNRIASLLDRDDIMIITNLSTGIQSFFGKPIRVHCLCI